jgi:uncharacterized protein
MTKKRAKRRAARRGGAKASGAMSLGARRRQRMAWGLAAMVLLALGARMLERGLPIRLSKPAPSQVVAVIPPTPKPAPPADAVTAPPTPPRSAEQPAWLRFAVAAPPAGERPRVAIVIDDCGLDRPRTARAIGLPAAVTLSFMTYAPDVSSQTEQAHSAGHELLVHVPMQPISARMDMGPNGLAIGQSHEEMLRRLNWGLDQFGGYVGINNHLGSRFTADPQAMYWVLAELKARGLLFLDSRTVGNSQGEMIAALEEVPYAGRDVFLDDVQRAPAVEARLKDVEAVARKKGTAIAIGHPHDATLVALNLWIAGLPRAGIVLVPLTDIVKARAQAE